MVECCLTASEASARSRGRASHEDCCAAARDPTGVGRAGFKLPAGEPELNRTWSCRGGRAGPHNIREAAPPPSVLQESDERARIQTVRERESEGDRDGKREKERGREGQR